MNARVRDRGVFAALNPGDLAAYLSSSGWRKADGPAGPSSKWLSEFEGEPVELLLPMDRQYKDYLQRMAETIPLIAAVERRSELEVLNDLQTAGTDIVRIRYRYATARDGTVPLDRAEAFVRNAREMLLAGACAAASGIKRKYYASSKPQQAKDYLQTLQLGQSERGSYVMTVLSPVAPLLQPSLFSTVHHHDPDPPFERRVVLQLRDALIALRRAADEAMTSNSMTAFDEAVEQGVSANLCEAIATMGVANPQPGDELGVGFSWARSRPVEPATEREIVFPCDRFRFIAEAARLYKAEDAPKDVEIRGVIVQLKTDKPKGPLVGPVIVWTVIDGKPRKVQITLTEEWHKQAAKAYESRAEVTCRGEMARVGNNLVLANPRGFAVVDAEGEG